MFAVSEVAPNGQATSQSQSQQQVIASVVALQRVIAGRSSEQSGDAGARNFSNGSEREKLHEAKKTDKNKVEATAERQDEVAKTRSEEARSIVEAQEASLTDKTITAAFQARHGLTDLLNVIRDPEDRMLPVAPES